VRRRAQSGFTLIEVMFAIAILAMAMTVVFSSNIIAARSTMHSRALTRATMMGRCRLTEAEAWLVRNQLPPLDKALDDPPTMGEEPCCTDGVTCDAQVDKIELPNPATVETAAGNQILGQAASAASGTSFGGASGVRGGDGGVALGGLSGAMGMMGGASGGSGAPTGAPSPRDMAGTLLTTVYPTVKPLLEGAIRRLTVTVRWHEGEREHSFAIVEYVTNPGQTLPTAEMLNALGGALPGTPPTSPGNTPPPRSP
jgi:prepilin-type N-terminal cleavage/methylation domain-containing protein